MKAIEWMMLAVCVASTTCVRDARAAANAYAITLLEPNGAPYHDTAGHSYSGSVSLRNGVAICGVSRYDGDSYAGHDILYHNASGDVIINPQDASHVGVYDSPFGGASLNGVGSVVGGSYRYGTGVVADADVWYYSPATGTTIISPTDGQHARPSVSGFTENNVVTGTSYKYIAGRYAGTNAWVYSPATGTRLVGLRDSTHSDDDDITANAAGPYVFGTSQRFKGQDHEGEDTWVAPVGGSAIKIGLPVTVQPVFGTVGNYPIECNASGRVIGGFQFDTGTTNRLQEDYDDAWLYVPGVGTQPIGLHDADHVTPQGQMAHTAVDLNDAGVVVGMSYRFIRNSPYAPTYTARGDAWYYTPQAGIRTITMTDAAHTLPDGTHNSTVTKLNASGNVIGSSDRTLGGADAWYYTAAGNQQIIGLTDAAHRQANGEVQNDAQVLTDANQVVGNSLRSDGRYDLYYFTPARGSQAIGLFDADHTPRDHPTYNTPYPNDFSINALGMVLSTAERTVATANGSEIFADPWVYDPATDKTYSLLAPGWASSGVSQLSDSGVAVGGYSIDAEHQFAFSWTVAGGFQTLGELVVPSLAARGWTDLQDALFTDGLGNIAGFGARIGDGADDSHASCFAHAAVPEPAGLLTLSIVTATAASRRRIRRRASGER